MTKKTPADLSWLPPHHEWDFRSITAEECRLACYWEYQREFGCDYDPKKPWLAQTGAERAAVQAAFSPPPIVQVRTFREFMNRTPVAARPDPAAWRRYTDGVYVIRPNFTAGVEGVIKTLAAWARKESKHFKRAPRAKAAAPPFHLLRWLAAWRLDQSAKKAGLKYQRISESLQAYQNQNRRQAYGDVFPGSYGSQGAWSKACRDAKQTGQKIIRDPLALLHGFYYTGQR